MSSRRGFTLIEALVATSILSVAGLGAVATIRTMNIRIHSAWLAEDAMSVAANQIELAVATGQDMPARGTSGIYNWELTYSKADRGSNGQLLLARVQVTWMERGLSERVVLSRAFLPRQSQDGGGQ